MREEPATDAFHGQMARLATNVTLNWQRLSLTYVKHISQPVFSSINHVFGEKVDCGNFCQKYCYDHTNHKYFHVGSELWVCCISKGKSLGLDHRMWIEIQGCFFYVRRKIA
ncbi:hypothetical protein PGT21_025749 [Puccinia graminis f. sp. tritici]|nr:hypothetical protein PGT21_025749 [Puccinia graminis f. sp. tritici]